MPGGARRAGAVAPECGVPGHRGCRRAEGEMMTWQSRFASETLAHIPIIRCRLLAGSRILAVLESAPRILRCVDNSVKWFTP